MGEQRGDRVQLAALGIVDRLKEIVDRCASNTSPRALDEGQVDQVLERRQDDAEGAGALRGEAGGGAIGEIADRGRPPRGCGRASPAGRAPSCRRPAIPSSARSRFPGRRRPWSASRANARSGRSAPRARMVLSVFAILGMCQNRREPGVGQSHRGTQSGSLMRREFGRLRRLIRSISSSVNWKSKTAKFSARRPGFDVRGMAATPGCWISHRSATCTADLP